MPKPANNQTSNIATLGTALNFELGIDKVAPKWLKLIPANNFAGHDGRDWNNPTPQQVIDAVVAKGVDIPIDIEHATEIKAPKGEEAPAVSWVKALAINFEVRQGAIFGRPDWKPRGKALIENEEYRYYSPVFKFDLVSRDVASIKSIGLTNTPNLTLTALNQEQPSNTINTGKPIMDELLKKLAAQLGLGDDATEAQVLAAIKKLKEVKATNSETHSVDVVPKADYDLALNRAQTAETSLQDRDKAEHEIAINRELDKALADKKIAPASKDYHLASCREKGGLERFKEHMKTAPALLSSSNLDGKKPKDEEGTALNAEDTFIAEQMGISVEDFTKQRDQENV